MLNSIKSLFFGGEKNSEHDNQRDKNRESVQTSLFKSKEEIIKSQLLEILPGDKFTFSRDFFVAEQKRGNEEKLSKQPITVSEGHFQKRTTVEIAMRHLIEENLRQKFTVFKSGMYLNKQEYLLHEEKKLPHNFDICKVFQKLSNHRGGFYTHSGYNKKDVAKDVPNNIYFNLKHQGNRKKKLTDAESGIIFITL
jgi:hypothetical protein